MLQTPTALLKKLKPSSKSIVTEADIRALARLAIDEGEDAFIEMWRLSTAEPKKQNRKKGASAPAKSKARSPLIEEATAKLKVFGETRGLKSDEMARAFLSFATEQLTDLPRPTAAAVKGSPAAVRWLEAKTGDIKTEEMIDLFVVKFGADTDYTYSMTYSTDVP